MSQHRAAIVLIVVLLAAAPADAPAQRRTGAGVGPATASEVSQRVSGEFRTGKLSLRRPNAAPAQRAGPLPVVAPRRPVRAGPYVVVGALVGAVAAAGAIAWYFEAHPASECFCGPITFAPAVLGGAAVGAAAGAVVYAVRRR